VITTDRFSTGTQSAITDGKTKVTFDYPADFADWLMACPAEDLRKWQWCSP
jgi:hypothetical protein